jgi:hypothetical protein
MEIISATDIKNRLGDVFDMVERDENASILIERNQRPVAMLLNAQIAEKVILCAYAQGVVSRSTAMKQLGLEWYGDLLQRMNEQGIKRPQVSAADAEVMDAAIDHVFATIGELETRQASSKVPRV